MSRAPRVAGPRRGRSFHWVCRLAAVAVGGALTAGAGFAQDAPSRPEPTRRQRLLQLAGAHRFPVVNLELLNDDTPPPMPADWSVHRCVSALVAGGAENFVIVGRADDPRLVKKVVIAPPGMSGADLARLVAREDPPPGYMMTPDGLLPIPEPPLEVGHDPARNRDPLQDAMTPEQDALAQEAVRWAAGIHNPVPVVLAPHEISPPTPPQPWLQFLQIEHPPLLPAVTVDPSVVNEVPLLQPVRTFGASDVPPPGPIKR